MTRADLKHCGKMPDAREELNRSVREGRIESRHSIKSLEGMGVHMTIVDYLLTIVTCNNNNNNNGYF